MKIDGYAEALSLLKRAQEAAVECKCYSLAEKIDALRKDAPKPLTCHNCGSVYFPRLYRNDERTFCSTKCRKDYNNHKGNGNGN